MQQQVATSYDANFFDHNMDGSLKSAMAVVPRVQEIVGARSVADVGCGTGPWLSTFARNGAERVLGIDGDYVDRSKLMFPAERFRAIDLSKPFEVGETFDLAVSLEVAEHLPPASAAGFVASLCRLAPVVLFSGAAPAQRGVDHVNEQWPEYWRRLFAGEGYRMFDAVRPWIMYERQVKVWYRTNVFLAVKGDVAASDPAKWGRVPELTEESEVMLVSRQYIEGHGGLGHTMRMLPGMVKRSLAARLGRSRG